MDTDTWCFSKLPSATSALPALCQGLFAHSLDPTTVATAAPPSTPSCCKQWIWQQDKKQPVKKHKREGWGNTRCRWLTPASAGSLANLTLELQATQCSVWLMHPPPFRFVHPYQIQGLELCYQRS